MCVFLTGAKRSPHAVAEMAGEELWSGVACCKGQPDGHTFLDLPALSQRIARLCMSLSLMVCIVHTMPVVLPMHH